MATPPDGFNSIYTKYLNCNGIAIVATAGVDDEALLVANETMDFMLIGNEEVGARIAASSHYYVLYEDDMRLQDLPEFRSVPAEFNGWSSDRATTSSGVELLCKTDELFDNMDQFFDANFFVHEFAHVIHFEGYGESSSKDREIRAAYDAARSEGLWSNTYAATDYIEYFADLSMIWFEVGRGKAEEGGNGNGNHVTTRDELRAYDPRGYELMSSVYNTSFDVPGCVQRTVIHPYLDPDFKCNPSVPDLDGNTYPVVRIGQQCWMAGNLQTTWFQDGTPIPAADDAAAWEATTGPARAVYTQTVDGITSSVDVNELGRLYNHAAVAAPEGLCPAGMRIPKDEEMRRFLYFFDPRAPGNTASVRLGAVGAWIFEATDDYGFHAKPSGVRAPDGSFNLLEGEGAQWSMWVAGDDPENSGNAAVFIQANSGTADAPPSPVYPYYFDKRSGASVRCMSTDFAAVSFSVGATVSGLDGGTVEIQFARAAPDSSTGVNSTYVLDANGPIQFDGALEDGWHYDVTVQTQPSGQTCTVTNGSGTISGSDVQARIDCAPLSFRLGATVSGLNGGTLALQVSKSTPDFSIGVINGYAVDANGPIQFDSALQDGWHYDVTVQTQPSGQTCTVTNGSGTISGDVNVLIDCV